ncbi:AAA family ATPase [[Mycobacterium] crassicus]|uniref:AAA family ATPase n=1 Tax=[Mycobacterium] crassicus TaxID=2872309 RepID=A0ABU5XG86_9MYCO|nr:AAA family ATPase [Mycolicibacter sp. MYC098]MEB3021300.1 AAA family ATPase [Mycolicibacter sp. MYC098]
MLYLITGPPAAGKTTWMHQHARPGDITIDLDAIAAALTPTTDPHRQPRHVQTVAKAARQAAIDTAVTQVGEHDVYVIHATPSPALLDRYRALGAQVVTIDPGRDVVLARCKAERPWQMAQAAKEWYATRQQTPANRQQTPPTSARTAMSW